MNFMLSIFISFLFASSLLAFIDEDFDGVEDTQDKCLDTPFMDLVDSMGCSTISLLTPHLFDIIMGVGYSQTNQETLEDEQTLYTTLQFDYSYKDFSLYATLTRYQNNSSSGLDDTLLGVNYSFNISEALHFTPAISLILPTYDSGLHNEEMDIATSATLSYYYQSFFSLASYTYTFINDTNTMQTKYQNSSAYQLTLGYTPMQQLTVDGGFYKSGSMYQGVEDIQSLTCNVSYSLDENHFILFYYSHGLSESASDNYASFKFGRTF